MRRLIALLALIPSLAVAQPTVESLQAQIDSLKVVIGLAGAFGRQIPCPEIEANRPSVTFPYGEHAFTYRVKQLGCAFNDVVGKMPPSGRSVQEYVNSAVAAVSVTPSPVVVVPPPAPAPTPAPSPAPAACPNCFAPLSPASQAEVVAALRRSIHFDWQRPWVDRIERELAAGTYSIVDKDLVDVLNFMIFGGMTAADNAIVERYRLIVDQRIPGTDTLFPPGDSRIRRVSGSPIATVPPPAPAGTTTSVAGVVNGKLCVLDGPGAVPSLCGLASTAGLFLGLGADIAMCSNVDRSFTAGYAGNIPHCGRIGVAPEGGIRIGYNEPYNNPFYDAAHMSSTLGFDAAGELSLIQQCSMQQPGCRPHEYTQDMVVRINEPAKEIIFASYRPGWKFCFVTSTGLITIDKKYCLPQQ